MRRRDLLLAGTSISTIVIAGCSGEEEPEPVDTETEGTTESEETDTPEQDRGTQTTVETESDGGGTTESGGEETTEEETDTQEEAPSEIETVVGELVEGGEFHLVVEEFERGVNPGDYIEPDAGNEFVVAQIALKNVSDNYQTVSQLLQSSLRDSEGYQYNQTFVGGQVATFNDGQFAPGEVERGQLAYEIPEDAEGLSLIFDFRRDVFGNIERATIDLENSTEVHRLEQDLQIEVYDIGQTIEYSNVQTAVREVRTEQQLDRFTESDEGKEYVIVDIEITNQTGEEQRFSTGLQMMIKDGNGWTYQEDITALSALDRSFDESTPLTDGETRRGELAYQVEEGIQPLYWVFEFDLFREGNKTFWQLR